MSKKKSNKTTHIVAILDASGSMYTLEKDVIGNFNTFLKEQQKLPGKAKLTLVTFDSKVKKIHDKIKLKKVKPITDEYQIGGLTALYDAIGEALTPMLNKDKVIVLIHTDGEENSSREYTKARIKSLIESKPEWEFIFVGADIDASSAGAEIGIAKTIQSTATPDGLMRSYDIFSSSVASYRSNEDVKV